MKKKKSYYRPETQPVISMIYIETPKDLRRLEQAAQDGRFHVTWFLPYVFRDVSITGNPVSSCNIHLTHNAVFMSLVQFPLTQILAYVRASGGIPLMQ